MLLSFGKSLTCVWLHRFRSLFRLFFQLFLYGQQPRNFSLLLLESYQQFGGVFYKIFPNPLHYIWTFTTHFAGVFLKIFYTPSLLLESFKPFVGVFLKKFIKISQKNSREISRQQKHIKRKSDKIQTSFNYNRRKIFCF